MEWIENFFTIKTLLIVIGVFAAYQVIKTAVQELTRYGIKGLFYILPKSLYRIVIFIPKVLLFVLKKVLDYIKAFFNSLKIIFSKEL